MCVRRAWMCLVDVCVSTLYRARKLVSHFQEFRFCCVKKTTKWHLTTHRVLLFNNVAELISFLSVTLSLSLSHCSMVSFFSSYAWIQFYISILLAQMLTVAFRFYMLRHQSVLSSAQLVHMYRQSGNNVSLDFLAAAARPRS